MRFAASIWGTHRVTHGRSRSGIVLVPLISGGRHECSPDLSPYAQTDPTNFCPGAAIHDRYRRWAGPRPAATEYNDKIFTAVLGTMETLSLYLGERLGWLDALASGPLTAAELAARTQTAERYAVEWMEMQAVYGNLAVVDQRPGPREQRRFGLPPGAAEVLTDQHSLNYLGALPRMFAAVGLHLDDLLAAYRTGGGVSWAELGADAREAQAAINRPWFDSELAPALASVPDLHAGAVGARRTDRRRRLRRGLVEHRAGPRRTPTRQWWGSTSTSRR